MSSQTKSSEQSRRFIDAAREHETDDSPEAFGRAFAKIVPPKKAGDISAPPKVKPTK